MNRSLSLLLCVILVGAGCSTTSGWSTNVTTEQPPATGTALNMSNRGLTSIPMDVFSRTDLTRLDLSKNQLTGAPQSQIGQLANLVELDLSGNALTGLPAELGQLWKLEILNVSNNRLTGLPMELGNLKNLRVLDVSGNAYSKQDLDGIAAKLPNTEIRR